MRTALLAAAAVLCAAVIAVLVARHGMPNLVGSGQAFAATHAVATLRTVHWAQGVLRRGAHLDADRDGVGEFGTLAHLAGVAPVDSGARLAGLLQIPGGAVEGELYRLQGYCYRVLLPGSVDDRERSFVAAAWPDAVGPVAPAVYCVDQDENVLQGPAGAHVGCEAPPPACPDPRGELPEGWKRWKGKTSVKPVGAR